MKSNHYYRNKRTNATTESRMKATDWYWRGDEVEVWHNHWLAATWEH